MDSIFRAQTNYAELEHAVTEDRELGSASDQPRTLGLLVWQLFAGMLGLAEALGAVLLTLAAPGLFALWAVPFASGALLLISVFTEHRTAPGVLGSIGSVVCGVAVVFVFSMLH